MVDKVRIKKRQQARVEQWSKSLEIPESRFVEDAIDFYLRHLDGKLQLIDDSTPVTSIKAVTETDIEDDDTDSLDNFTGGIEL